MVLYLWSVVSEPIVSLSEVVKDDPASVPSPRGQNNRGAGVRLWGDPGTVEGVGDQKGCHQEHNTSRYLQQHKTEVEYIRFNKVRVIFPIYGLKQFFQNMEDVIDNLIFINPILIHHEIYD